MLRIHKSISPSDWGLEPSANSDGTKLRAMGLDSEELERRAHENTYVWLMRQFDESVGAFYGYYDPRKKEFAPAQTANLIAPFQLLAAFDRYGEEKFLHMARRCSDWLTSNLVDDHPMSLVMGGVCDNIKETQLWTKYTADYVQQNIALFEITQDERFGHRATRGGKFLLQAQNHDFAPKYDHWHERWMDQGWQSFGRVAVAMLAMADFTHEEHWMDWATAWAEYGVSLQSADGCFYLINNDYYSSDIAADEMRALVRMYWLTQRSKFLEAATRFADWHLDNQCPNGAWPLSVDRWGVSVGEYVGPGDIPNIAIAMLLMHEVTGEAKYVVSAARAVRYSLTQQAVPGTDQPFGDDENTHWGFWSWDPKYDYTVSSDQSTHHVRGYWFFLDYFLSLPPDVQDEVVEAAKPFLNAATDACACPET